MSDTFLYLSRADVNAAAIAPSVARLAIDKAFRGHAREEDQSKPKLTIQIAEGHAFQALCAASQSTGVASIKWVSVVPVPPNSRVAAVQAMMCLNDYETGSVLAVMDGDEITTLRTAAMSAAAAQYLAPAKPLTIGFIGCGAQARAHFHAMTALFPSLKTARAYSRSRKSADLLAQLASDSGMHAESNMSAEQVVRTSDIVISSVPNTKDMSAFLDPRWLQPSSFVAAVDLGRSWLSTEFDAFNLIATDCLQQDQHPLAADGSVIDRRFDTDLSILASQGKQYGNPPLKSMFNFRGHALGDLAIASLVFLAATQKNLGTRLPR